MKLTQPSALLAALALGAAPSLFAGEAETSPWGIERPAYLSEVSLTTKLGFDSSIYGTDINLAGKPAIADIEAAFVTFSPKILVDGTKLLGLSKDDAIKTLSFGYNADITYFHGYKKEDSSRHFLPFSLKGKNDSLSFNVDNTFLYIDGTKTSPLYSTYSAYGTAMIRERREQIQDRFNAGLRFDGESTFVRASATALIYDLYTQQHNSATEPQYKGWQNWVDRSDMNLGFDFGYKATKTLALVAGYRIGQQTQDRYQWGGNHSEGSYHRILVGIEGKPLSWLTANIAIGPDIRRYSDTAHLGLTGSSHTWIYGEGSLVADLGKSDKLTITGKAWHWVSSTGNTSYQDATYSAMWKHSFSKELSLSAGVKFAESDYDAPALRVDQLLTYPISVAYAVSKQLSLSADYQFVDTHNKLKGASYGGRDYMQHTVSVSLKLAL